MELPTQQTILKPDPATSKYALPEANITTINPTPQRPLGSFLANVNISPQKCWRMPYDARKIYACFESEGFTSTIYNLFCAETQQECIDKAAKLGLTIPPDPTISASLVVPIKPAAVIKP